MMICELIDNVKELSKADAFVSNYCICQNNYRLKEIYNIDGKFQYKYIICHNDKEVNGVMPFAIYNGKLGNIIHSMPYIGYGGIGMNSEEPEKESIFENIISFLNTYCKEHNIRVLTICTPPFREEYELYKKHLSPDFEKANFYQYIDLKDDVFGNLTSKFRGNIKRNIKKSQGYGVELIESYSENDLRYWYEEVYVKRMKETGCTIYPYTVFYEILTKCKNRVKVIYAKISGKIIGGGMFLDQGISLDNFMRVVDSDYFYTQAGNWIDYYSIEYAKNKGIRYYNWQSCDEIGSSIYKYKEDWGSKVAYHYYLTKITGDISELKNTPLDIIKSEYKGVYVMPYEVFKGEEENA